MFPFVSTRDGFLNAGKRAVLEDFAIPFGDDDKDASIWFLDHNYHEVM